MDNSARLRGSLKSVFKVQIGKSDSKASPSSPFGTDLVISTNGGSISSLGEILPKFGLSPGLLGVPHSLSPSTSNQHNDNNKQPISYQRTKTALHAPVANQIHRPNEETYGQQHNHNHGSHSKSVPNFQIPIIKSPLYTSFKGDESTLQGPQKPFSSKINHGSGGIKPQASISQISFQQPGPGHSQSLPRTPLHQQQQQQQKQQQHTHHQQQFYHQQQSNHPRQPQQNHQQQYKPRPPPAMVEEVVIGKPLPGVTSIRPSLPDPSNEYAYDSSNNHESVEDKGDENGQDLSSADKAGIQSSQSDHTFAHITTNYYIPQTINSEKQDLNSEFSASDPNSKPFLPSPQVEFFVPKEAQEESRNPEEHAFAQSDSSKFTRPQFNPDDLKTEEYFLPKFQPDYHTTTKRPPPMNTLYNFNHNPGFSTYFKFGTSIDDQGSKAQTKPHTFPTTSMKVSYGHNFKPNPDTSFSAYPTNDNTAKYRDSVPSRQPAQVFDPKTNQIQYIGKEDRPVSVTHNTLRHVQQQPTKQQYHNHDFNDYEQIHRDYMTKYQGAQKPNPNNYFQREFASKFEAENYVKNSVLNNYKFGEGPKELKQYLPQPQPPKLEVQYEVQNEVFPGHFDQSPSGEANGNFFPDNQNHNPHEIRPVHEYSSDEEAEDPKQATYSFLTNTPSFEGPGEQAVEFEVHRPHHEVLELEVIPQQDFSSQGEYDLSTFNTEKSVESTSKPPYIRPSMELKETITSNLPRNIPSKASRITNSSGFFTNSSRINTHQPSATTSASPLSAQTDGGSINAKDHDNHKTAKTNNNRLLLKSLSKPPQNDVSEKSSKIQNSPRRQNPRQKMISCERSCIRNKVTQEYDPVCGNDGKSYSNRGKLRCIQECGKYGEECYEVFRL